MGKDLNGKELGTGLRQRSDGKYVARFLSKTGKRPEKAFEKITEAKTWLRDQKYLDEHTNIYYAQNMTLNAWYEYWYENIKKPTIRAITLSNYERLYRCHIKNVIGQMLLSDIKPLHCQMVLNNMTGNSSSTMQSVRTCMQLIFGAAVDNEIMDKNPVTRIVKIPDMPKKEMRVLTVEEQEKFVDYLEHNRCKYKDVFLFCLETGLRTGELIGLMWTDVSENSITVRRSMVQTNGVYYTNPPKTKAGMRIVPLSQKAKNILKGIHNKKVLSQYVFSNNGDHLVNKCLYVSLQIICRNIGIDSISMHGLRHSFATRCNERGMNPKTLQKILGHSNIKMTMDCYVHVTEETLMEEMRKVEIGEKLAK